MLAKRVVAAPPAKPPEIGAVMAEPFCLTLTFGSGALLRIYSDNGPYECGQIFRSDAQDNLIVF
jgi:hypothetical protein